MEGPPERAPPDSPCLTRVQLPPVSVNAIRPASDWPASTERVYGVIKFMFCKMCHYELAAGYDGRARAPPPSIQTSVVHGATFQGETQRRAETSLSEMSHGAKDHLVTASFEFPTHEIARENRTDTSGCWI